MSIDAVYLDFEKAFDKVSHTHLIYKLRTLGVGGNLMMWIASWLLGRRQRVRIDTAFSDWVDVTSSVAQGTVLGPLLFIVYVADLCLNIRSPTFQFVDNVKLLTVVQSCVDLSLAQRDIDLISAWCTRWLMQLNPRECVVMNLSPPTPNQSLTVTGSPLTRNLSLRDLGVHYNSLMKFNDHVDRLVQKVRGKIQRFRQVFRSRQGNVVLLYYLLFLRPLLEYAIPVWWGVSDTYRDRVERMQRSFLRLIFGFKELTYDERLRRTKLLTISERSFCYDVTIIYKAVNSRTVLSHLFKPSSSDSYSLRSTTEQHLSKEWSRLECRQRFFTIRGVDNWNSLPLEIREQPSIERFKRDLRKLFLKRRE
eukprot:GHVN01000206.1.p1 GENE.GHVN01000206.1~~GHVN01000206.1.p1  ORF type:complete len:364 (+),score=15.77 GHVN01000206.1:445-1536(+)